MSGDHSRPDEHAAQEFLFHPFADIFPMMDEAALAELAADIKAESQREPIHLWQDQIIDGRNRYAACKLAGVEPIFKKIEFPGGDAEALAYVVSRNLKRRHLNAQQRADTIRKMRALPQWREASNVAIAKLIGVSEAVIREIHRRERSASLENWVYAGFVCPTNGLGLLHHLLWRLSKLKIRPFSWADQWH